MSIGIRRFRGSRTSSAFQIIYGVRYWEIDTEIRLNGVFVTDGSQDWVDGFVGGRVFSDLTDNWMLIARGDIGAGGSDLTWNISTMLVRNFQGRTSLAFGYRFLDVDYEDGSGADLFKFDVQMSGPIVGLNISWPKR